MRARVTECGEQCLPGIPHQALSTAITHEGQVKSRCSLNGEAGMGDLSESASPRFAPSWRMGRAPRFRSDHLDAQVADSVAQQVLEVLVASRFSEDRADEQMLDPGGAKVEGEEGMQLVPRIRRAGVPIRVAEHAEEHRELAEQGNTGIGQRCFVSVVGHVVGHVLPRLRLVHLPAHSLAVATGLQDAGLRTTLPNGVALSTHTRIRCDIGHYAHRVAPDHHIVRRSSMPKSKAIGLTAVRPAAILSPER